MTDAAAPFKEWLSALAEGRRLSEAEAHQACDAMVDGRASAAQIGAFLMALRMRGETVDELVGLARSLRERMVRVNAPEGAIDTCGTGGDGSGSFNVSTAAAFVIAGAGVPVAKHGNRAATSQSGSADVLTALGVDIDAPVDTIETALHEAYIGFMMAPRHHPATRFVAEARRELGIRTIFNFVGPLTNPAGVRRQVIGVSSSQWVMPVAEAARRLGSTACWVVHGDGYDEITTTGATQIAALRNGDIQLTLLHPEAFGLTRVRPDQLAGGTPAENAALLWSLLEGNAGPLRDIVCLNAAAALVVAGKASGMDTGLEQARASIDSGAARRSLQKLISIAGLR